ncbi:pyridoxamine 5'-phosphate oxidase family protein [Aminipila butyrica]|uniref:Pyridoxamine 5'-phosphate oxidase family protein n=1 Tax=Aminipila butyrica TaxID=433296 RepID=A0A858BSJ7_9FIRM|nr:pyridoxamine 5'-phosphate oxidase family protein [Aminipila butyrica]QIB68557.1 pyridoxamine 5'-phosphate oxidase family protein [Aminipila butyrica]
MRDAEKTIGHLIDKQKVAFISSIDTTGFPNTKAMLPPRKREGIQVLYFTTNTSSLRVAHYKTNPHACIYFCDKRFFRGVMLRGTMEVLADQASKEMIWQEGDTMYYPKGVTDPDYCVLKFTGMQGRYYSNFKSEDFDI